MVVVVAAVLLARVRARRRQLHGGRPPELSAPDHQRVVQHPPLFEVLQQRSDRPVHLLRQVPVAGLDVVVVVPGLARAVVELDKPHAALQQPAGDEHLLGVDAGTVQVPNGLWLARHVKGVRGVDLHAVGKLERLDASLQRGVVLPPLQVPPVQLRQQV